MTKAKISEYDAVAANNTDVNGVNIAENCPPSGMNNMGREIMAALKRFQVGSDGDGVTVGGNLVVSGTSTLSTTSISSADINAGTIDGTAIGGSTAAAGSFTTLNTSGQVVFNDAGADVDFRVEGDTDANLLFVDAGADAVGIGTSSPTLAKLVVSGSGASSSIMTNTAAALSGGTNACLIGDDGTDVLIGPGNSGTKLSFLSRVAGVFSKTMTLDSSGNLLVGTTGISTGSFKGIQNGVNSGGFANYLSQNPAGTSTRQWSFGMNNSDEYVVYGYNNTSFNTGAYIAWGGTSWTAQSDERSKDIIEPIADAVNKVSTLRAVIGKYKTDEEGTRRSFLIAQDVQAVLPEAVDASKPDNLGLQYTEVIPLLVAAIKELKAITDTQAQTISALEARIAALEGQ
jgi:hypothetical protein